jgi:hypothetical protein
MQCFIVNIAEPHEKRGGVRRENNKSVSQDREEPRTNVSQAQHATR